MRRERGGEELSPVLSASTSMPSEERFVEERVENCEEIGEASPPHPSSRKMRLCNAKAGELRREGSTAPETYGGDKYFISAFISLPTFQV